MRINVVIVAKFFMTHWFDQNKKPT